jgi:glyoxylase-like metal-dependent hydrolase (beta-lactamase superfamily II)
VVAQPETVKKIEQTWAAKVQQWKPLYKDAITSEPLVPRPLKGRWLRLENEKIELHGPAQGDDVDNSWVFIPSLQTAITGDIVYDGVYSWTAETTPALRKAWAATLDEISARKPAKVVPGHQVPARAQDPANLTATRDYLAAFDAAVADSKTPDELQQKVKGKYPDLALDVILKIGAEASLAKAK